MTHNFSQLRINMWLTVLLVSIIGDVGTTWLAIETPLVYEANPLWQSYFNNKNYFMLLFGKIVIVGLAFMVDAYFVRYMDNWAIPLIPVYFIYSGSYATLTNIQVLSNSGMWTTPGLVIMYGFVALVIVELLRKRFGYEFAP